MAISKMTLEDEIMDWRIHDDKEGGEGKVLVHVCGDYSLHVNEGGYVVEDLDGIWRCNKCYRTVPPEMKEVVYLCKAKLGYQRDRRHGRREVYWVFRYPE